MDEKKLSKEDKKKILIDYSKAFAGTLLSTVLLFISFRCFMSINVNDSTTIISGGCSGLARTIALIFNMCGLKGDNTLYIVYSISYFILNIPSIILSFKFGKKYAIFTILNIVIITLLTSFVNLEFLDKFAESIACIIKTDTYIYEPGLLIRTFLAALLNGAASVIAYSIGASAGGADTIGYYFAVKKSSSIGKPLLIINISVIILFSILYFFSVGSNAINIADALVVFVFAILYQLVLTIVIDLLSKLNKKEQLQIITENENVAKIVTTNTKHSCTIVKAKGAFTGKDNFMIYTTITTYEVKQIVDLIRKEDPKSFIDVITIKQVYGRFINKYQ